MKITDKKVVAHFVGVWLNPTCNWIDTQVTNLEHWRPIVLCWNDNGYISNVRVVSYSGLNTLSKLLFRILRKMSLVQYPYAFHRVFKKAKPSLIHSHFGPMGYSNLSIAEKYGLPHIVSVYGADITTAYYGKNELWKNRYQNLFQQIDFVICEGPSMADKIETIGCHASKIKVIPLGIDTDRMKLRNKWRETAKDPLRILVIGTFRKKKGITFALQAFSNLISKYPDHRISLTLIGDETNKPGDAEEKARILRLIERENLSKRVDMKGFVDKNTLDNLLNQHDVLLAPSVVTEEGDAEGGAPVSLIEASATGCCVVSTEHCDIPWLFKGGELAFLSKERDIKGLVNSLEAILLNPDKAKRIAIEASEYIRERHSISRMTKMLEKIYDECMSEPGSLNDR